MAIQMIGIDHSVAAIDIRTVFSFTQKKTVEALEIIKQEKESVAVSCYRPVTVWNSGSARKRGV